MAITLTVLAAFFAQEAQAQSTVAVFDDPAFVDSNNFSDSESDTVQASLVMLGHTVITFTGIAAEDFQDAIDVSDCLLIPELEVGDLGDVLSPAAATTLSNYVSAGGGIIVMGASNFINQSAPSFMNAAFGFSLVNTDFGTFGSSDINPADVAGTAFEGGPTPVPNNNGTHPLTSGLPAGTLSLYLAPEGTTNAIIPFGTGKVMYLGWDWFDAVPLGGSDGGWLDILDRAIAECEGTCFTLDFETDDSGNAMVHGTRVDTEFDGGATFPVTITATTNPSGDNTAAILNSSTGPALQDPDLLVGCGNILILQHDGNQSECAPGVYCTHNDDEQGGLINFEFGVPVTPSSIVLIDIDSTDSGWIVNMFDSGGDQRIWNIDPGWTGDLITDATSGKRTLDLTSILPQPGFMGFAGAGEIGVFDPTDVVRIRVNIGGSGGVDDLSWCQTPVALASARLRNGMGMNPSSLSFLSLPALGSTFTSLLDCSAHSSGMAMLELRRHPTSGTMTVFGETLIHGDLVYRSTQAHSGSPSQFTWAVPNDFSLCGVSLYAQGLCTSTSAPGGTRLRRVSGRLSNAVDLVLGF